MQVAPRRPLADSNGRFGESQVCSSQTMGKEQHTNATMLNHIRVQTQSDTWQNNAPLAGSSHISAAALLHVKSYFRQMFLCHTCRALPHMQGEALIGRHLPHQRCVPSNTHIAIMLLTRLRSASCGWIHGHLTLRLGTAAVLYT